jgi:hypothetical protein
MFTKWWKKRIPSRSLTQARRCHLQLEALETRCAPAVVSWNPHAIGDATKPDGWYTQGPVQVQQLDIAPSAPTSPLTAPLGNTQYRVSQLNHENLFLDTIWTVRTDNGRPGPTMTVAANAYHVGDIVKQTDAPTNATYYMVIVKGGNPLPPYGLLQLSRIVAWDNGKPRIKGLNYLVSLTAPRWWYDQVKVGDVVREVNPYKGGQSWRWGEMNPDPTVEQFLVNNQDGMPNVLEGNITTLGPQDPNFNCIAYAATYGTNLNPGPNPGAGLDDFGWITDPGMQNVPKVAYIYQSYSDLLNYLGSNYGWKVDPFAPWIMSSDTYLVLFTNASGGITHAAIWTPDGVYAKMGKDGTFRFDSLDQMAGPLYGEPTVWLKQ